MTDTSSEIILLIKVKQSLLRERKLFLGNEGRRSVKQEIQDTWKEAQAVQEGETRKDKKFPPKKEKVGGKKDQHCFIAMYPRSTENHSPVNLEQLVNSSVNKTSSTDKNVMFDSKCWVVQSLPSYPLCVSPGSPIQSLLS